MTILSESEAIKALYNGVPIEKIRIDTSLQEEYNKTAVINGFKPLQDVVYYERFLMPQEYHDIDLTEYFSKLTVTLQQKQRVKEELNLFSLSEKTDLLRYAIYLSDVIKHYKIVTGVGRGSSVSVYVFFLCGLHKVDSLLYNLEYTDFFKIKENTNDYS